MGAPLKKTHGGSRSETAPATQQGSRTTAVDILRLRAGARSVVQRPSREAYLFIAPAGLVYLIFVAYPTLQVIGFSFFTWTGLGDRQFAGLANYAALLRDGIFWTALSHNLIWVILTLVFPVLAGLLLAAILAEWHRSRTIISAVYFIPRTIPFVVSAIMWGWVYNPIFGLLNTTLRALGLGGLARSWLGEPSTALYALNVLGAWTFLGFCVLIFLAALQGVDPSMYEAASLDGATWAQQFRHITVPSVRRATIFLSMYAGIEAMRFFDIVYVATKGGPGYASEVLSTYIYKQFFLVGNYGYAATISVVLLLLVFALTVLVSRLAEERL